MFSAAAIISEFNWHQGLVMLGQAMVVAILILGLFHLRKYFGFVPLYITIGVFQHVQVILAGSVYVQLLPNITVSPGSVVLFTAAFFAILLVYVEEDATEARKLCYGLLGANLAIALLSYLFSVSLSGPGAINPYALPNEFFVQGTRIMAVGTIALVVDIVLVIVAYEWISRFIPPSVFLRTGATMVLILSLDTVIFATGSFVERPDYGLILASGIIGKSAAAVFYALILDLYFRWLKRRPRNILPSEDPEVEDVFHFLTFRQKYELLVRLNRKVNEAHRKLQVLNESLDQRVRLRTRELEEAQEQLVRKEKLATMGQMAGSVAHEIRNPLGVIKNNLYFLKADLEARAGQEPGEDRAAVLESIDDCFEAIDTANGIVTELLDFARTPQPSDSEFSLAEAIENAVAMAGLEKPGKVHVIFQRPDTGLPCRGDVAQITRVLHNLLKNAAEEMPDGGTVTLTATTRGETTELLVSDTGPGIPRGKEEKIFESLYTGKARGIGLGLALSRRYAQLNGGDLVAAPSTRGGGAVFKLTLRAAAPSNHKQKTHA